MEVLSEMIELTEDEAKLSRMIGEISDSPITKIYSDEFKELLQNQKLRELIEKLDFGILLQSLRDDFSEDKDHVPNDVLKKMIKNTETMLSIQKLQVDGKK